MDRTRAAYEPYLRSIEGEAVAALRRLVDVNSFTRNRAGVVRNAEICEELFTPLGFHHYRVRSVTPECGDHLILRREGDAESELVMVSHLDTVFPPEQEEWDDFRWREEGDRIYGPGTCDIKGGTVLIWMVMRALKEKAPELFERVTWKLIWNASEEGSCADFGPLLRGEISEASRACLVYECGEALDDGLSSLVTARKGGARFLIEAFGREAHSGNAHARGANAIRELASKVETIEAMTDYERDVTFNVGMIRGGTSVNSVPARAHCLLDVRAWTPEHYADARRRILALTGPGVVRSHDGQSLCRVEATELDGYPAWPKDERTERLAQLAVGCAVELGLRIVAGPRRGGSDGCHTWDLVPTLDGLGPLGRNAHCSVHAPEDGREQESVDRTSFVPRALLSLALIGKACSD